MKKLVRRFELHRETLCNLAPRRLSGLPGGAVIVITDYSCEGSCVTCTQCRTNCIVC